MMEWWNNGMLGLKTGPPQINLCFTWCIEKKFHPSQPIIPTSNIPSFHGIFLRHSRFTLAWPRGPGFLNLNKNGLNPFNNSQFQIQNPWPRPVF